MDDVELRTKCMEMAVAVASAVIKSHSKIDGQDANVTSLVQGLSRLYYHEIKSGEWK
jgi:hypothetical protein